MIDHQIKRLKTLAEEHSYTPAGAVRGRLKLNGTVGRTTLCESPFSQAFARLQQATECHTYPIFAVFWYAVNLLLQQCKIVPCHQWMTSVLTVGVHSVDSIEL